jgi:hypothetical protein
MDKGLLMEKKLSFSYEGTALLEDYIFFCVFRPLVYAASQERRIH